jgi:hypothetical protein
MLVLLAEVGLWRAQCRKVFTAPIEAKQAPDLRNAAGTGGCLAEKVKKERLTEIF